MQEDVRQHGRDRRALRTPAIPLPEGAVLQLQRRFQPPLHVEEDPPQVRVVSHRVQNERVIERVEERLQVQIQNPVVSPTPLPTCPQRIMSRPSRPIPIGIPVEHGLHLGLQVQVRDRLSDPVRDSGHAEHSRSARLLRYLHRPHRRREITPRGHPIPDLVEVRLQVRLKRQDRLLVNTRSTPVGLDPSPCLPDQPLGNHKRLAVRFRLAHPAPPARGRLTSRPSQDDPSPSLQPHYRTFTATTVGPPLCPASVLYPSRISRLELSLPQATAGPRWRHWSPAGARRQVPTFHTRARTKLTPPPCRTPPGQSTGHPPGSSRAG